MTRHAGRRRSPVVQFAIMCGLIAVALLLVVGLVVVFVDAVQVTR